MIASVSRGNRRRREHANLAQDVWGLHSLTGPNDARGLRSRG
jgi:hypothetical protein